MLSQFQQNQVIFLPSAQFSQRSFRIIKKIGEGGQGIVFKATPINWGNFQQDVALKVQSIDSISQKETEFIKQLMTYQFQEQQLLPDQQSQIVKIYDFIQYQNQVVLIMELGQQDLYDILKNQQSNLSFLDKIKIMQKMTLSIRFLHKNGHIHRDIKPENFVRFNNNEYKLIDFGLVNKIGKIQTPNVGTYTFQAPEISQGSQNYSFEVDIWSLGATFFELLTNSQFNIQNLNQNNYQIINTINQPLKQLSDELCKKLLQRMLQNDPKQRITIDNVLEYLRQIENFLNNDQQSNFQQFFNQQINDEMINKVEQNFIKQQQYITDSFSSFQNQITNILEEKIEKIQPFNQQILLEQTNLKQQFQNQLDNMNKENNKKFELIITEILQNRVRIQEIANHSITLEKQSNDGNEIINKQFQRITDLSSENFKSFQLGQKSQQETLEIQLKDLKEQMNILKKELQSNGENQVQKIRQQESKFLQQFNQIIGDQILIKQKQEEQGFSILQNFQQFFQFLQQSQNQILQQTLTLENIEKDLKICVKQIQNLNFKEITESIQDNLTQQIKIWKDLKFNEKFNNLQQLQQENLQMTQQIQEQQKNKKIENTINEINQCMNKIQNSGLSTFNEQLVTIGSVIQIQKEELNNQVIKIFEQLQSIQKNKTQNEKSCISEINEKYLEIQKLICNNQSEQQKYFDKILYLSNKGELQTQNFKNSKSLNEPQIQQQQNKTSQNNNQLTKVQSKQDLQLVKGKNLSNSDQKH